MSASKPKLLSGGNPQIPKGDGDGPVQAYIAAMPGWKSDVGRCLDALVTRTVPDVRKAVKWNSPFYGIDGLGWFLSFHCFTKYVKVTFFNGAELDPLPPEGSKDPNTRYLHIHEHGEFDEQQFVDSIRQASGLPGRTLKYDRGSFRWRSHTLIRVDNADQPRNVPPAMPLVRLNLEGVWR